MPEFIQQKLDRAGSVDSLCSEPPRPPPRPSRLRSPSDITGQGASSMTFWCRRCIGTIALAKVHNGAVAVPEHLHFHVAWTDDGFLEDQLTTAKGGGRLRPR